MCVRRSVVLLGVKCLRVILFKIVGDHMNLEEWGNPHLKKNSLLRCVHRIFRYQFLNYEQKNENYFILDFVKHRSDPERICIIIEIYGFQFADYSSPGFNLSGHVGIYVYVCVCVCTTKTLWSSLSVYYS